MSERIMKGISDSPGPFSRMLLPYRPAQHRFDARSCRKQPTKVVCRVHERPLTSYLRQPAQQEPRKPARLFDLAEDRFDDRLAHLVDGAANFGAQLPLHPVLDREIFGDPASRGRWHWLGMFHFFRGDVGVDLVCAWSGFIRTRVGPASTVRMLFPKGRYRV